MEGNQRIAIQLDFFLEEGNHIVIPNFPVTISRVGTHQGMPVCHLLGPCDDVRRYMLEHWAGGDEEMVNDHIDEYAIPVT